jgi:hypothetical protein
VSDPGRSVARMESTVIDCDSCQVAGPACQDCVVSVLLGIPDPADVPVPLDGEHARAIEVLAGCGLVPPLRLQPAPGRRVG